VAQRPEPEAGAAQAAGGELTASNLIHQLKRQARQEPGWGGAGGPELSAGGGGGDTPALDTAALTGQDERIKEVLGRQDGPETEARLAAGGRAEPEAYLAAGSRTEPEAAGGQKRRSQDGDAASQPPVPKKSRPPPSDKTNVQIQTKALCPKGGTVH
jgi:hypothetical protein